MTAFRRQKVLPLALCAWRGITACIRRRRDKALVSHRALARLPSLIASCATTAVVNVPIMDAGVFKYLGLEETVIDALTYSGLPTTKAGAASRVAAERAGEVAMAAFEDVLASQVGFTTIGWDGDRGASESSSDPTHGLAPSPRRAEKTLRYIFKMWLKPSECRATSTKGSTLPSSA